MELKIDLLNETKRWRIFVPEGYFCAMASVLLIVPAFSKSPISWIIYCFLALGYIFNIWTQYLKRKRTYILINSEFISVYAQGKRKKQLVNWEDIESIECKLDRFKIKKTDNTTLSVNLHKFAHALSNKIKDTDSTKPPVRILTTDDSVFREIKETVSRIAQGR